MTAGRAGEARKERVAFIGVGNMGSRMARRLLAAGWPLRVYDRRRETTEALQQLGARVADSAAQAAAEADFVLLSLPDPAAVQETTLESGGVLGAMRPGTILVDLSTGDPGTARAVAAAATARGIAALDAPVSGGVEGAERGTLTIMVGGERPAYERTRHLLEHLGSRVVYVGPSGSGQVVKLCNNMAAAAAMVATSEVLLTGMAYGLPLKVLADIMESGTAQSWVLSYLGREAFQSSYEPGFALGLLRKDVELFLRMAEEARIAAPVCGLVVQVLRIAASMGYREKDVGVLAEMYRTLNPHVPISVRGGDR
ncbi:MAG: NAD(P)-dependent oxidoreductase [Armatimonadota bacterium]|nr:NAD(P)-dependent oxidoreductase [Armatimonadota bacterium]